MKRSQLIGVSVAGLSAVAAFVLMKGFIKPQAPVQQIITEKVKSTEVLVARTISRWDRSPPKCLPLAGLAP